MPVSQKITQKITLPQTLTESLRVDLTGLPAFRAEIEKRLADPAATVTHLIEIILAGGIVLDSSDIHLEGQENDAKLRVRLDGVLQDVLVDGAIGTAVGTGIGALGSVALAATSVTLFIASPLVAPLMLLGWGASIGGLIGAAAGATAGKGSQTFHWQIR